MRCSVSLPWLLAAVILLPMAAWADTVRTRSGEIIHGKTRRTRESVLISVDGKVSSIPTEDVEWLVKGNTWEIYQKKLAKAEEQNSAKTWLRLGTWLKSKKMLPEAREAYQRVLAHDPQSKTAHRELGHHLVDERWLTEDEFMASKGKVKFRGKWIDEEDLEAAKAAAERERLASITWFEWDWTLEDDLGAEEFEAKKRVVEMWQTWLWKVGEGNFALRKVTVRDRTSERGTMHTPAGRKDARMLTDTLWAQVQGGTMVLPGNCDAYTWLHELGHLLFNCPEEYDSPGGCPCVEATGAKGGEMQWCDASNHSAEQAAQHEPCWEGYILKKYPNAKHPGPGGPRPPVKIAIRDS